MLANIRRMKKMLIKMSFLSVLIILSFLSVFMIFKGKQIEEKERLEYCYNINNDINYKVFLYENSFFDETYIDMNKTYTSDLINYIDINFVYKYSSSKKTTYDYKYYITATIIGKYGTKEQEELWTKKYTLKEETKNKEIESNSLTLKENVKINYEDYLLIVRDFKKQLKLSIDATLEIVMNVEINGEKISETQNLKMLIPLTETTFKIKLDYKDKISNTKTNIEGITIDDSITNTVNGLLLKLGIVLLIFNIGIFLLTYRKIFNIRKKGKYEIEKAKIFKKYGEIIVEISNIVEINEKTVLSVLKIEDMVDIEEELRMPILYYEKRTNKEGWFIIKHGKDTYRYILKEDKKYSKGELWKNTKKSKKA